MLAQYMLSSCVCLSHLTITGTILKILYFSCILMWQFWSVEILLNFNLAFSQGALVLCKLI